MGVFQKRLMVTGVVIVLLAVGAGALLLAYIKSGGLRARRTPSKIETVVAQGLVDLSVPGAVKGMTNPASIQPDSMDVAAGRELYQKNCVICHGYDGSGKTVAGKGLYPPPLDLRRTALEKRNQSDGVLFYFIQNGVRNTGMPAWPLSDRQIWQVVAYLHNLPEMIEPVEPAGVQSVAWAASAHYVGSAACQPCHAGIYERWRKTPMANVVRDPREHPDAIIPDLGKTNALVKFTARDVAFVYGSIWKQRYFTKIGDDYYPEPAQWDVTHKQWRPYNAKDDWWVADYPPDNFHRPTSALCDGCHSVNFDIKTKQVTEWNVGCERCHGPGSEHVQHPAAFNIVNPIRQDFVAANDVCVQCHSQGRPLQNPMAGRYYDWPVGYDVTRKLSDYWKLEDHKLGETTFTHFADGTAHKNRMQGNDFVTSLMYTHGVACFTCHDVHGTGYEADLRKPASVLCLDCHGPNSPNGPHAPTLEAHTHHKSGSPGSDCIACHMPRIAQTIADVNVRSHTFRFVDPATADALRMPNACNICHSDKSAVWASAQLKTWGNLSPWRVAK